MFLSTIIKFLKSKELHLLGVSIISKQKPRRKSLPTGGNLVQDQADVEDLLWGLEDFLLFWMKLLGRRFFVCLRTNPNVLPHDQTDAVSPSFRFASLFLTLPASLPTSLSSLGGGFLPVSTSPWLGGSV